jgi:cytoskeletal protein RodZ
VASAKIEDRFDEMAKGTFGEHLKRERELREVTIDEICSATRIAPKFLNALENEQWAKLPGGVFGHGFVRTIARYLGLSEENLLSEYDLARGEAIATSAQKPEERIPSTPKWVPAMVVLALLAALAGLFFASRYAWHLYTAHRAAKKISAVLSAPSQEPAANAARAQLVSGDEQAVPLDLSLAASQAAHVRVVADGAIVHDGDVSVGQGLHFSALSAAPALALLLQLNGQTVMPAGTPGSSGTILLTSKDLRPTTGGSTRP